MAVTHQAVARERVIRCWLGTVAVGVLVMIASDHWGYHTNIEGPSAVRRLFNLGREDSLGAAFGIMATFLAAIVAWAGWWLEESKSRRRGWFTVGGFLTLMAVDDAAHIHERVGTVVGDMIEAAGPGSLLAWFPSYSWQIVFVPTYGLLGVGATSFLWVALRGHRLRWAPVGAFACWVAAVFLDFIEGLDAHHLWHPYTALARAIDLRSFTSRNFDAQPFDAIMHFGRVAEESLEMIGVGLIGAAVIWLALRHLDRRCFRLIR